jgi:transcription initiation factor IIE alpha subunit
MKTQNENKKKFELKLSNQDLELKKKKEMIEDLESQVKDLMFYLDTQKKVGDCEDKESIQSGQLIVTNEKVDPKKKKKKK